MSANPAQRKAPWILAALLLFQVVLMSTNARHPDSEQSFLRVWVVTVFSPVVHAADAVLSSAKGFASGYLDVRRAREENVELHERVDELMAERNKALERAAELDLIRTQLALPSRPPYRELAANVQITRSIHHRRINCAVCAGSAAHADPVGIAEGPVIRLGNGNKGRMQ